MSQFDDSPYKTEAAEDEFLFLNKIEEQDEKNQGEANPLNIGLSNT